MCATGVFENERVYFAYGSNLHPLRVIDRLGSDIRLRGIAEVGGYRLEFSKRSSTAADLPVTVSLFVRTYEKSPGKMRTNTGTLPESTWLSD